MSREGSSPTSLGKKTIMQHDNTRLLIVDDESEIRRGYSLALNPEVTPALGSSRLPQRNAAPADATRIKFEITEAEHGEQALKIFQQEFAEGRRFAAAIVDVRMPGRLDGLQFIQEAWKIDPDLLVAVATAYQDRSVDEINRLFGLRFQDQWDYLNKPFSSGEIVQKARQLISLWNRREKERNYLRQIEAQQKALASQEQLAALGGLARSVGHEFGNILQQLVAKLDLMQVKVASKGPSDLAPLVDEMVEAASLGSKICQDLLTFARENLSSVNRTRLNLKLPVEKALRLVRHELKKKDIHVEINIEGNEETYCNESQMIQIFVNLFINAIHALKEGGHISISSSAQDDKTFILVSDDGAGIAAQHMAHLFEPLFTTKGVAGNGLGLYVCKTIMDNHGGSIDIQSELGKGTNVKLGFKRT